MQPFNFRLITFDEESIPPDTQIVIRDIIAGVVISKQDFIKWYKRYCQISDSIDYTKHNKVLVIIPNDIQNCLFNIDKSSIRWNCLRLNSAWCFGCLSSSCCCASCSANSHGLPSSR